MDRSDFTQRMWLMLPDAIQHSRTLTQIEQEWWYDARPNGGWRLTTQGFVDFTHQLQLQSWRFDFAELGINSRSLLKLKHYLVCPYAITDTRTATKLTVFDSRIAVTINLYGQVDTWLKSLS